MKFTVLKNKLKKNRDNPWLYFVVTFGLTWLFFLPAAISGNSISSLPVVILIFLGGVFGKLVPPLILPYLTYGRQGWRDYWERLVDYRRISLGWWLVTLSFPVLFVVLGVLTASLLGIKLPTLEMTNPLKILLYTLFILLYGPLPEELGWAGYELDRLQAKYSALKTGVILGFFWMLWHLPLFFIEGSYQQQVVGFNTLRFWFTFLPGITSLQILQVWIYNNTNRSTLSAVMIHFMTNFCGEMLALSAVHEYLRTFWTVIITVAVVVIWGPKTLTGQKSAPNFKKILNREIN